MQERQTNRRQYFQELATTSKKYYIPYISMYKHIEAGMNVLEVGCGDGGNLLPFSEMGCSTTGVDIAECRIRDAKRFFDDAGAKGTFIAADVFQVGDLDGRFDIIICHDVVEHILDKDLFIKGMRRFLAKDGVIFFSFPAWQMPFGGHQQICRSKLASHLPFIHLLPVPVYAGLLGLFRERQETIDELLDIKRTRCSIEKFQKTVLKQGYRIVNHQFYFINPHYEVKFGLKPRKLSPVIGKIPYLRNFFTTSCFYILEAPVDGNE